MARRKAAPRKSKADRGGLAADLEPTIVEAVALLDAAHVRYALIGGLAVGARASPRFTADVDFAVACEEDEAEQVVFAFQRAGFLIASVLEDRRSGALATVRLKTEGAALLVDLLFSFVGIEDDIVAAATVVPVSPRVRAPAATVAHLIAMKVQARRPKDLADLDALLQVSDEASRRVAARALAKMVKLGTNEGRDLVEELRQAWRLHRAERRQAARRWMRRR